MSEAADVRRVPGVAVVAERASADQLFVSSGRVQHRRRVVARRLLVGGVSRLSSQQSTLERLV